MSIPIKRENTCSAMQASERCCFCRNKTKMWTDLPDREPEKQVACCEVCSNLFNQEDAPTKEAWCERESKLTPKLVGLPYGGGW